MPKTQKEITLYRDFRLTSNRGILLRACGDDWNYTAFDFADKKLSDVEIDKSTKDEFECETYRFRGFFKMTRVTHRRA